MKTISLSLSISLFDQALEAKKRKQAYNVEPLTQLWNLTNQSPNLHKLMSC